MTRLPTPPCSHTVHKRRSTFACYKFTYKHLHSTGTHTNTVHRCSQQTQALGCIDTGRNLPPDNIVFANSPLTSVCPQSSQTSHSATLSCSLSPFNRKRQWCWGRRKCSRTQGMRIRAGRSSRLSCARRMAGGREEGWKKEEKRREREGEREGQRESEGPQRKGGREIVDWGEGGGGISVGRTQH